MDNDWLKSKNIHFDETVLKSKIPKISGIEKGRYIKYVVKEMATHYEITVLNMPIPLKAETRGSMKENDI